MEHLKTTLIIFALFLGIFGQRFQRHSSNVTKDELNLDVFKMAEMNRDQLESDNDIVLLEKSNEEYEIELLQNGNLKLQMCTSECESGTVIFCFDSDEPKTVKGFNPCASNQCEVRAGFYRDSAGTVATFFGTTSLNAVTKQCDIVTIQSPTTKFFDVEGSSCYPKKHDGNVVKINLKQASTNCFAKIIGARKWIPPTSTPAIISSTPKADDSTMKAETMWIIIGVVLIVVVIALACSGFWGCRYWKQKKSAAKTDGKTKQTFPDKKVIEIPVKQEKAIEETVEKGKPTKDETEEKKEIVQSKPKKVVQENVLKTVAPTPKKRTVEPTQEETPTNQTIEPTVEDTVTNASIIQHAAPNVTVSKELIQSSRPYGFMRRSESSKSGKTDSLSGRHDGQMNGMVVNPLKALKGQKPNLIVVEMEKFYPVDGKSDPPRPDPREIQLLCCRISVMFKIIEELVNAAEESLKKLGVKFDESGFISELPQKALNYLTVGNCPEYIRYFAFGNLFRDEIDSALSTEPILSIPLLFVIIFQRRYPAERRRKACAWIRRQLPILRVEFSFRERESLCFPLNALEAASEKEGFKNIEEIYTLSKEEKSRDGQKKAKKNAHGKKRRSKAKK